MNDQIVTFAAEPVPSRWTYFKMVIIVFVFAQVGNFFAQLRLVQAINWKLSFTICTILSLLIAYFLSRSPLTKSLTIDYTKRLVIVGFATLTKANDTLEFPFERLGVKIDADSDAADSNAKWKMWLTLDDKNVYLLLSSESNFSIEQMNEFKERVENCQTQKNI